MSSESELGGSTASGIQHDGLGVIGVKGGVNGEAQLAVTLCDGVRIWVYIVPLRFFAQMMVVFFLEILPPGLRKGASN